MRASCCALTTGLPFLAGAPTTVMPWPDFSFSPSHPARRNEDAEPSSMCQRRVVPCLSFASNTIDECGLTRRSSTTVPTIVTGRLASKSDRDSEWWADTVEGGCSSTTHQMIPRARPWAHVHKCRPRSTRCRSRRSAPDPIRQLYGERVQADARIRPRDQSARPVGYSMVSTIGR